MKRLLAKIGLWYSKSYPIDIIEDDEILVECCYCHHKEFDSECIVSYDLPDLQRNTLEFVCKNCDKHFYAHYKLFEFNPIEIREGNRHG